MRKTKKILAILLSLAMVVSALASFTVKVDAATLSQDELDSIAGTQGAPMTNMVLGTTATVYPGCAEGNIANLTNGNFSGHCALSSGWGYSGEAYAILDLGDYYYSNSLDEIILAYKDYADNDTVVSRTFNIQYSTDSNNWETKYTSPTISAADLEDSKATVNDVSGYTGKVRYIKIDYPSLPTYGIQLTEIAVLAEDPQVAPMETCDDPDAVTASSSNIGVITFNITAGPGQQDYRYYAYLDDVHGELLFAGCRAGVNYTVDCPGGSHTIFVQSHYNGAISPGINSNQVTVNTYESKVTDSTWNFAYTRPFTLDSGSSTEGSGSLTDGVIASNSYVTPTKTQAGSWACVELNSTWKATSFETLVVWFRSPIAGTYPENGGLKFQYSTDGTDWRDVAVLSQSDFDAQKSSTAPFPIKADVSSITGAVKYVRVYYPNSVAYGAQMTELGVYDIDGDAEEASSETVVDPANFTAASSTPNTISGTITAPSGHSDYTYNIYLNGSENPILEDLSAGSYTISCVDPATYDVTVKSEHNGFHSPGITVSNVTVASGFVYSTDFGTGLFPDSNTNGNNYITLEGSTVPGVSATASSGAGGNAIDYNAGTRWESSSSDPQWLLVDMGAVRAVKEFAIWWETASSKDFVISISTDGVSYQDVAYKNNAASGANRRDSFVLNTATNARYIKITGKNRTTGYGHSIIEMAVYGPAPTHTITIDGTQVETALDGTTYTLPTSGTEYSQYGYILSTNHEMIYKPGGEVTVNSDLSFIGIDQFSLTHNNGASIRLSKSDPGLSFGVTASVNNAVPEVLNHMKFGLIICPFDIFVEEYQGNLTYDNTRNQAHMELNSASDWANRSTGLYRIGIGKIKQFNFDRSFTSRAYMKLNYADGTSAFFYAENPSATDEEQNVRKRSIKQTALKIKADTEYYNSLPESQREAVDYFIQ